jgi:hypothetical protein
MCLCMCECVLWSGHLEVRDDVIGLDVDGVVIIKTYFREARRQYVDCIEIIQDKISDQLL